MFSHRSGMVAARILKLQTGIIRAPSLPEKELERALPPGLPRGTLIELAAGPDSAPLTIAVQILLECQREGDPIAWVQTAGGELFPPDLAAAGIDLSALLVVHVPISAGGGGRPKAAEMILRTGAFGGVALDVSRGALPRGDAWLGRLASLARQHDCRCVFVGPDRAGSLGPLIGVRVRARRRSLRPGRYALEPELLKDKRGVGPILPGPRTWTGPPGMP